MSYVPEPKSELLSLVGTLTKKLDWYKTELQTVCAKKRGAAIHMLHNYRAILLEFEGFGDLFGYEAKLKCSDSNNSPRNLIGINNTVTLHYIEPLSRKGLHLVVEPSKELS